MLIANSLPSESKGTNNIFIRHFKNFNRQSFRDDIQSQKWNDLSRIEDPNEMWL